MCKYKKGIKMEGNGGKGGVFVMESYIGTIMICGLAG